MKKIKFNKTIIIVLIALIILVVGLTIAFFALRKPVESSVDTLEVIPEMTLEVGTETSYITPSLFFKDFTGYNEDDFKLSFVGDIGITEIPTVKYYLLDNSQVIVIEDTEIPEDVKVKTVITGLDTYTVSIKGPYKTYTMRLTVIDTQAPKLIVKTYEASVQEDTVKDANVKDLYNSSCYDNSSEACEDIYLADENGNILDDQTLPTVVGDHDLYLVTKDKTGNISDAIKVKFTVVAKPKDKNSTSTTTTNKTTTNKNTTSSSSSSGSTANKTEEKTVCGSQGYEEPLSHSKSHGLPSGYVLGPDTAYIWGCDHEPILESMHENDGPLYEIQSKELAKCKKAYPSGDCITQWHIGKITDVATGKWVGVESRLYMIFIDYSNNQEHTTVAEGFMLYDNTIRWIYKNY